MAKSLTIQEIQERVKGNDSIKSEISAISFHDKRAKFHTVPQQKYDKARNDYYGDYIQWVGRIIDQAKQEVFEHLLILPVETVDFTESIFNQVKKIFQAEDRFIHHSFVNDETSSDFSDYLRKIGDNYFWEDTGFEAMKNSPSAVLLVDMPSDGSEGEAPEPYYYLLDTSLVINAGFDRYCEFEWIIFKDPKKDKLVHAWDGVYYRSFDNTKGKMKLIVESAHNLGYCPAKSFWSKPFDKKSKLQKRGVITNTLSRLDWSLFLMTSSKHETLYAGFPIDIMYEQQCSYVDDQGNPCEDGIIHFQNIRMIEGVQEPYEDKMKCPSCSQKQRLGAGTQLTAPAMADKEDPDLIGGLNRVGADVQSLEWIEKKLKDDKLDITWNIIGISRGGNDAAKNELQVASNYESRLTALLDIKKNFEKIHKFAITTIGKLRYGSAYQGSVVNYGEQMFIHSLSELNENFEQSKKNGMPIFELAKQQGQIMHTKYQNNPEMIKRVDILRQLEPYQTYSIEELMKLSSQLDKTRLALKLNFPEYINRFERENMNIVGFMQFSDMSQKIEIIKAKLMEYVQEDLTEAQQTETPPTPPVPPSTEGDDEETA